MASRRRPRAAAPPPGPPPVVTSAEVFALQIKQQEGQLRRTAEELLTEIQNYLLRMKSGQLPIVCDVNPSTVTHLFAQHATLLALKDALHIVEQERPKKGPDENDCTCYTGCEADSHSGTWHQHEDEPCPVHPNAPVVG